MRYTPASSAGVGGTLAATGASTSSQLIFSIGLLLMGGSLCVLVVAARRRRSDQSHIS